MRPNILLVVLDALRRDTVEPYRERGGLTPAIGELARRGVALRDAYATASWTLPSHASMFTGMLPRRLGLGQPPSGTPEGARAALQPVADRILASVLSRAGYATEAWSTNLWASQHAGFDIGFDRFAYWTGERLERSAALLGDGPRAQLAWALDGLRSQIDDGAARTGRSLRAAIASWSGQPAFWFVNLCECHSPYLPPRPWNDLDARDRLRAALEAKRHLSFEAICLFAAGRWEIPDEALERMRHLYARAAAYMDGWLADVLQALDRRGILEQTLVIVTSDHGENFAEAGLIAHGFSLDQRLIHVPLVLAGPGAADRGGTFSLAQLPRLVATAAGLEHHPWADDPQPNGIAVAQHDPLGSADDPRVRDFAARHGLDDAAVERMTAAYSAATDGRHKLVVRNGAELLYDLEADPGETAPLDPSEVNGALAPLRAALANSMHHPATQAPTATTPTALAQAASAEEVAALERQMKLLGYL